MSMMRFWAIYLTGGTLALALIGAWFDYARCRRQKKATARRNHPAAAKMIADEMGHDMTSPDFDTIGLGAFFLTRDGVTCERPRV